MSYFSHTIDEKIARLLRTGGVGLIPSDTIYGLSCRALDEDAVSKLRSLKKRSESKRFIVLISNLNQLSALGLDRSRAQPVEEYWPGPISLEMDAKNSPLWLHPNHATFAVRMPNNKPLLDLIEAVGPITSTSANLEGGEPAKTCAEAKAQFGEKLDFYVDSGELSGPPSTLVQEAFGKLKVIREGAVKIKREHRL